MRRHVKVAHCRGLSYVQTELKTKLTDMEARLRDAREETDAVRQQVGTAVGLVPVRARASGGGRHRIRGAADCA